jgi:gas vesicle protein
MTNANKIMTALAAGVAIGGVLGILFAPDKGENTRKKIADNSKKFTDTIRDKVNEGKDKLSGIRNNVRERVDSIRGTMDEYAT